MHSVQMVPSSWSQEVQGKEQFTVVGGGCCFLSKGCDGEGRVDNSKVSEARRQENSREVCSSVILSWPGMREL